MRISTGVSLAAMLALMALPAQAQTIGTYTYDALGRVTQVAYPDGGKIVYEYDLAGNRTQVVRTPGGTVIPVTAVANLRTLANAAGYAGGAPATYNFVVPSANTLSAGNGAGAVIDAGAWPAGATLGLNVDGSVTSGSSSGDSGLYVQSPINLAVTGALDKIRLASGMTLGLRGVGQNVSGSGSTVNLTGTTSTMTLKGDTNTINAANGTTVTVEVVPTEWYQADTVNMSGATLKVNANSRAKLIGSSNTTNIGYGASLSVTGDNNVTNPGSYTQGGYYSTFFSTGNNNSFLNVAGASVYFNTANTAGAVSGFNNTISGATGDILTISSPNSSWDYANNVLQSSGTVNLTPNAYVRIYGTSNTVGLSAGTSLYLDGAGNTVSGGNGSYIYVGGTNQTIAASGSTIQFTNVNTTASINGQNNTINGQSGTTIGVTQTTLDWNYAGYVNMSYGTLNLAAASMTRLNGGVNTVSVAASGVLGSDNLYNSTLTGAANSKLYVNGNNNTITAAAGAIIAVSNPTFDWGSANNVTLSDASASLTIAASSLGRLWGSGNTVTMGAYAHIGAYGDNVVVNGSHDNTVWVNGNTYTVNAASSQINLNNANTNATINGNNNTINAQSGGTLYVSGTGITVNISNATVHKTNLSSVTVNGSNVTQIVDVVNQAPVCESFTMTINAATTNAVSVNIPFFERCTDADSDTLTVTTHTVPYAIMASLHSSTPVSYTVSDGHGGTASATITVVRP